MLRISFLDKIQGRVFGVDAGLSQTELELTSPHDLAIRYAEPALAQIQNALIEAKLQSEANRLDGPKDAR